MEKFLGRGTDMVRNCGGTEAASVIDAAAARVKVRGRASATASSAGASAGRVKRRRTGDGESESLKPTSNNSTCTQLRSCAMSRNLASPPPVPVAVTESFRCLSTSSEDHASVSCCSSYGSSEVEKDRLRSADLEECSEADSSASRFSKERREETPSSEVGGEEETDSMNSSAATSVEPNPPQRSQESRSSVDADLEELFGKTGKQHIKRPSDFEIEEFFAAAEDQNLLELEHFKNKYNFDFIKEQPLKGRFQWHQISPLTK